MEFRSNAHFLMLSNLKFLELQKKLLNRFQKWKTEEVRILKKENMKMILYEWAKELVKQNNKPINITEIPSEILTSKKISEILKTDVECKWLIDKITLKTANKTNINEKEKVYSEEELKIKDNIFFDEYPSVFYYEYPQFPYNYYEKKKMTNFYSLIKFPYNDILNISKNIKKENKKEVKDILESNRNQLNSSNKETLKKTTHSESEQNILDDDNIVVDTEFVNFSSDHFVYAPTEMETSKEKHF